LCDVLAVVAIYNIIHIHSIPLFLANRIIPTSYPHGLLYYPTYLPRTLP
jgi:hypothetical protein